MRMMSPIPNEEDFNEVEERKSNTVVGIKGWQKTHGMEGTPIYKRWESMLARVKGNTARHKRFYTDRGITVCNEWRKFENFYRDMGEGFKKELSLDRIDTTGNYCKENCRWIPMKDQHRNTSQTTKIPYKGKIYCIAELAEEFNIPYRMLYLRIQTRKWDVERAVTTPKFKGRIKKIK